MAGYDGPLGNPHQARMETRIAYLGPPGYKGADLTAMIP